MVGAFPDVIENERGLATREATLAWLRAEREALLARLAAAGALLLRGFPVGDAADFDALVEGFDLGRFSYRESLSNAVRVDVSERVFTANEAPPEASIRLHHELAQTPAHPRRLFFFCETPATRGGATALCRSDALLTDIEIALPDFARAVAEQGLVYHHVMPAADDPASALGRSWRHTLGVRSVEAAEEKLAGLGYVWRWQGEDLAVTSPRLPGVLTLEDGRRSFFNQLVATRAWRDRRNDPETALRLGDGDPVPLDLRDRIAALAESRAVDLAWQGGDVALVDNHLVQHGRRPFVGRRRVLVAFSARAVGAGLGPPQKIQPGVPSSGTPSTQ